MLLPVLFTQPATCCLLHNLCTTLRLRLSAHVLNNRDALGGDKHLLFVKNSEHSMITGIPEVLEAIAAWAVTLFNGQPLPQLTWDLSLSACSR